MISVQLGNKSKQEKFRSHLFRQIKWSDVDEQYVKQLVDLAKKEDLEGSGLAEVPEMPGDATTLSLGTKKQSCAKVVAREDVCLSGLHVIPIVLEAYGTASFEAFVFPLSPLKT